MKTDKKKSVEEQESFVIYEPIEMQIRKAAPIIAVYEGLRYLQETVNEELSNPNRDQMPYNPTQNVALYALYAESYLGRLLKEYKEKAIDANESRTLPRGINESDADAAMLLCEYEAFIAGVYENAVMNDEVATWAMVINQGMSDERQKDVR